MNENGWGWGKKIGFGERGGGEKSRGNTVPLYL